MTLYIECNMGAAGDMLMGALYELLPDGELFLRRMRGLGLPGVEISAEPMTKCGILGTKMRIRIRGEEEVYADDAPGTPDSAHPHTHAHSHAGDGDNGHPPVHDHTHSGDQAHSHQEDHRHYGFSDVCDIINNLDLAENVRDDVLAVYRILGEAEAAVHGTTLEDIRFHELGTLDAVVDIVGCSLLFHMLGAHRIEASPVHVGSGSVHCAHGLMPVPTPATARILQGIPIYGGRIRGELCTPTGAALLRHFVRRFGEMEPMSVSKIGYGMGSKDFEAANCVRALLSDSAGSGDTVVEIICNLDDMTPEAVGFATQLLLDAGALDVFTTPIYMKKNRPAVMLTCLCRPEDRQELTQLILAHTATCGVRYRTMLRSILEVSTYTVDTPYGEIRIKTAHGLGVSKQKPEYEDVKAAALRHGVPFAQVWLSATAQILKP
jgi:uncharacterized protein (TIGR00299 family) protein